MTKQSTSNFTRALILGSIILFNVSACDDNKSSSTVNPITENSTSPKNILAVYEKNQTQLTWEAPNNSNPVSYYQVERSIHDKQDFVAISDKLPATQLTLTDPVIQRKFGDSFVYRVIAGYSDSSSPSELSTVITPGTHVNFNHEPSNFLGSNYQGSNSSFGFRFAFNADGTSVAVASKNGQTINGSIAGGTVEIFNRVAPDDWSSASVAIIPFAFDYHLVSFDLSPDGKFLAMSDGRFSGGFSSAGFVQIFTKNSIGEWNTIQVTALTSPKPGASYNFGSVLLFSPDNKTLAVAETGTGIVRLYSHDNTTGWSTKPTNELNISTVTELRFFDPVIAFNSNSDTFAIGDLSASVDNKPYSGTVQLFSKNTNGNWDSTATTIIKSNQPGAQYRFGQSLAFSPDGNSIAIGEEKTQLVLDNNKAYTGGNVQLFSKDANNWKIVPDTSFVSSASETSRFGSNIAFNSTGTMLAISELRISDYSSGIGAVSVYKKDSLGWEQRPSAVVSGSESPIIDMINPNLVIAFSPGDNTLFVADNDGYSPFNASLEQGQIYIYDSALF